MTGSCRVFMASDDGARARAPADTGKIPMKKKSGKVDVIVLKGDRDVEGTAVKQRAVEVLLGFTSLVLDIPVQNLENVFVLKGLDPSIPGDPAWIRENVFRKADIYGTADSAASKMRAEKAYSVFNTLGGEPSKVGIGVVRYYLDQMYLKYDVTE